MPNPDPLSRDIVLLEPVRSIVSRETVRRMEARLTITRRLGEIIESTPLREPLSTFECDLIRLERWAREHFPVGTARTEVAPSLGARGRRELNLGPPEAWGEWEKVDAARE